MQQNPGKKNGNCCLANRDQQIEQYLSQQILCAGHRIREHLVEDAVVAIHEERPGGVRGDAEARHSQHSSKEERVVVHTEARFGEPDGPSHPNSEHQQISKRVEKIPEDERQIGRADLAFAVKNGAERSHSASLFQSRGTPPVADTDAVTPGLERRLLVSGARAAVVNSTNTSSRLAPLTSRRSTRPLPAR